MATTPPMTPPATATVDWTALLFKLGMGVRAASGELVPVASTPSVSVGVCGGSTGVCGDSMVLSRGVATGPWGRSGERVSAGVASAESRGVSAAGAVTLASA
jgi:hypothetical protein